MVWDSYHKESYSEEQVEELLEDYLAWCKAHDEEPEVDSIEDVGETNISHVAYHAFLHEESVNE